MKKFFSAFLALLLLIPLTACGAAPTASVSPSAKPVTLTIFAASSLTDVLNQIAARYKTAAPDVTLTFDFDSSGTLQTQIQSGADCDIFFSAAEKQMDALDSAGLLLPGTRADLLGNVLVVVAPKGNPANINSFADAAAAGSIALGNSDVPAGQYAQEVFTNMGLWNDALLSKATLGTDVKEVTSWVSEGAVDCGVVYATDANAAGLQIVASAPADSLTTPIVYPAAVLAASANPDAAKAFLAYLRSDAATAVFEAAGFTKP